MNVYEIVLLMWSTLLTIGFSFVFVNMLDLKDTVTELRSYIDIKRSGLSMRAEDGSKPYGYDYDDKVWRSDVIDLFGHGSTYTSEEAQKMIKNLPSVEVGDLK